LKTEKHRSPTLRWCIQSLRFYKSRHLIFALTAALCAAILSAALGTGESLQIGLLRDLRARLGDVRSGVVRTRGLFPVSLAERIPDCEAALMLRGEMLDTSGIVCAGRVNILGIPQKTHDTQISSGAVSVNGRASDILSAMDKSGWSYRFEKPSPFSVELPLGTSGEDSSGRGFVSGVYPAKEHLISSDFDPSPASVLPVNIRVPHEQLAAAAGVDGAANLLLSELSPDELKKALQKNLVAQDAGLQVNRVDGKTSEIKRLFTDFYGITKI
jgi:hypothetical protein